MGPNHPLLLALWLRICKDKKWETPDETNEKARQAFLTDLPASPGVMSKGIRCSFKKWMAILHAVELGDESNGEKLLVLV